MLSLAVLLGVAVCVFLLEIRIGGGEHMTDEARRAAWKAASLAFDEKAKEWGAQPPTKERAWLAAMDCVLAYERGLSDARRPPRKSPAMILLEMAVRVFVFAVAPAALGWAMFDLFFPR